MKRLALLGAALASALAFASPSGHKWFITGTQSVPYRVYNHTSITGVTGFGTNVLPRVNEAFLNWTRTRVACTSWGSSYQGTFTAPCTSGPCTSAVNSNDSINNVIWLGGASCMSSSCAWRYGSSTLGLTTTLYYPGSGQIIDADMELNNDVTWASNGSFNAFDFESVVLHEAGHFLGLDHTTNINAAVMWPSVQNGQLKRTLAQPDITDVCGVYPGNMMQGSQGSPCTGAGQCAAGLVCRGPAGATGGMICTVDCTGGQACPAMLTCQAANMGMACLVPSGSPDYCKFCTDGSDCSTGNCLTDGRHNWCTNACSPTAPCPTGSGCFDVNTGGNCAGGSCVCAPMTTGGIKCPGQCTGATCAAPGYACVSGTCEATGNAGDRCEVSIYCQMCMLCVGTSSAAYCRTCCQPGSTCGTCPAVTCPGGQACGQLSNNSQVCLPQNGADLCQACSGTVPCLNGNTCVGGKCHSACNPVSPGSCPACQPSGASSGLCACPGEERNEGDPCGGAGVAACRTGLACVNGFCKARCQLGNPASCPSGKVCRDAGGGVGYCETDTAGARCAACNGATCGAGLTCYQGRCYTTCNVSVKPGPCDYSCVDVGGGTNVCACDDQIHGSGAACGASPIAACQNTLLCIGGVCVGECNPNNAGNCPLLTECKLLAGTQFTFVCQPIDTSGNGGGGSSGVGGGTSGAGGGTGGNSGTGGSGFHPFGGGNGGGGGSNFGCGCTSAANGFVVLLALVGLRRRRR